MQSANISHSACVIPYLGSEGFSWMVLCSNCVKGLLSIGIIPNSYLILCGFSCSLKMLRKTHSLSLAVHQFLFSHMPLK